MLHGRNGPQRSQSASGVDEALLGLHFGRLWRALKAEPAVFWALCFYVGVEYLRPQNIYPQLDVLPWGQVTLAACLITWVLDGARTRSFYLMDILIVAFTGWWAYASVMAWDPAIAQEAWTGFASWLILYFIVTHVVVTRRRLLLFWLAFMLVHLKMSQHGARTLIGRGFGFASWGATGSPVWFQNSGEFAMAMVIFLAMSWCLIGALRPYMGRRKYLLMVAVLPLTAAMSILASSSRGGQLAVLPVLVLLTGVSRRKIQGLLIGGLVFLLAWQFLPAEQKARFETMGDDETSQFRLTYWADARATIRERPLLGVGYENWVPYYQAEMQGRPEEVHNTFLEAAVELGLPAAALFVVMILNSFFVNRRTRWRARRLGPWAGPLRAMTRGLDVAMVGLVVSSIFMSVLFWPVYWMAFGLTVATSETTMRLSRRRNARVWAEKQAPSVALPTHAPAARVGAD